MSQNPKITDIHEYLRQYQKKELLRFVAIGSVDDGKSTLIGRLLHDTNAVYADQLQAVKKSTKAGLEIDFSLITDGLKAEREQGITIDVAYRYFSTEKRKFIIADTPGHVQYTRNMATGASTAQVAIVLIDARLGILPQSKRHAFIASLLGIPHIAVCINKMDLKNYDEKVFVDIKNKFLSVTKDLTFKSAEFFPISALRGDNIVTRSKNTPWYGGKSILEFLETVPISKPTNQEEFSFPVQYVIRPNLNFRGYAGTIASGTVRKGDKIVVLPSGKVSHIKAIHTHGSEIPEATTPQAVLLTLADEVDISRSDMLVHENNVFHVSRNLRAMLVWMHEKPLDLSRQYWMKQSTRMTTAMATSVDYVVDVEAYREKQARTLKLNDIGKVAFKLATPLVFDLYKKNRSLGAFILIDRLTNATVAAGMISDYSSDEQQDTRVLTREVTSFDRSQRFSQKPCLVWIEGLPGSGRMILSRALEKHLFDLGHLAYSFDRERLGHPDGRLKTTEVKNFVGQLKLALDMGTIALVAFSATNAKIQKEIQNRFKGVPQITVVLNTPAATCAERLIALGKNPKSALAKSPLPRNADVVIDGKDLDVEKETMNVIHLLKSKKILQI